MPDCPATAFPPDREADNPLAIIIDLDHIARTIGRRFASCAEAVAHYRALDEAERFDPSPFFSRAFYRQQYFDIRRSGVDPLLHFLAGGFREQRCIHPLFDAAYMRDQLGTRDATHYDLLVDFVAGRLEISPHPLIDLDFVRAQLGESLPAVEVFRIVADIGRDLLVAPHPLFSPSHYALNARRTLPNALADYVACHPSAQYVHPLFSAACFLGVQMADGPDVPALISYLRHWGEWNGDPSLLVDLKFLNHQLARREAVGTTDPLTAAMRYCGDDLTPLLHPHVDGRMIAFAFGNLLDKDDMNAPGRMCATALGLMLAKAGRAPPSDDPPRVSVIILNYHKPAYTLLSALAATNALRDIAHEILIIENGGEPFHFEELTRLLSNFPQIRCHKLQKNKFFGEGSNIGLDRARGEQVLFLNNDCYLHHSFGRELQAILRATPGPHATGAALYFPDGHVQEFGGTISDCGGVVQRAKHCDADWIAARSEIEAVDYASAACLLMSRDAVDAVAGFDPVFEPFYYEDTDLCRRLKKIGVPVRVSPRLRAMHVENASTREFLGDGFGSLVARNRETFARRWLKERGTGAFVPGLATALPTAPPAGRPTALVFTPFEFRAGGGERYLLSAARVLAETHDVTIATETETSRARIRFLCHTLGIEPFSFVTATLREALAAGSRPDVTLVMGNEIVPPIPAIGRRNFYHLQFPFPWRNVGLYNFGSVARYDGIIVNSHYTRGWTLRRLTEVGIGTPPPVHVVYPPVRLLRPPKRARTAGPLHVVNVGRFFTGGHSKRQDAFLDAVVLARAQGVEIEATLIGGVHNSADAQAFFQSVAARVHGMRGVRLLVDASRCELEDALHRADLYLHCAGLGIRTEVAPECAEHFGISIVEALSAGCYPLVAAAGGPLEIIASAGAGASFTTIDEAAYLLREAAEGKRPRLREMPGWLADVSEAAFDRRLRALLSAAPPRVETAVPRRRAVAQTVGA